MVLWLLATQINLEKQKLRIDVGEVKGPPTEVVLLIDVSGSMVKLDPSGLAQQGAKMVMDIASVLNANVKVSVIFYGEKARFVIRDLDPHGLRSILEDSLKNVKPERYSDIREALKLAASFLNQRAFEREAYVIVLTDGQIKQEDIPPGESLQDYLDSLVKLSAIFKKNGWKIYTFTTQEPVEELRAISAISGGEHRTVSDLKQISKTFLDIIRAGQSRFRVDVNHNSIVEFPMEEGVAEFSMVIAFNPKTKKDLRIYDPDGREVKGERRSGRGFVIVKIKNPKPGTWKFEISKGATILLSMAVPRIIKPASETPSTEPVPVLLQLEPITPKEPNWKHFSAKVYVEDAQGRQVAYDLYDDGKHNDGAPNDGVFGRMLPRLAEGEYTFTVVVNHLPTDAEIRVKKKVKVVYIPILDISFKGQFLIGTPMEIVVGIRNRSKPIKSEQYTLTIRDPKGQVYTPELKRDKFGYWRATFPQTFYGGTYTVEARGRVVVKDSNRLRTFPNVSAKDSFSLCIAFTKSKVPGFLFFGEMPGRTYTHRLVLTNHCDTTFTLVFTSVGSEYSDSLKDRGIPASAKPRADTVPSVSIDPMVSGTPGKRTLDVVWHIPKDAVAGTYRVRMRGVQRPTYHPIEIIYPFKVGSWRQVWLTLGGVGALVVGGGVAAWYLNNR
ncbi:MAG: VWA domain-containing protein [Thermotogae bacterium]|nr:VWA domain-containing protein [Thermotogota bacterium]